jgi:hypothetical protein
MTISSNYIGGTLANCGGSALTFTNTSFGNKFCGININTSNSGAASSIQGNTISNIAISSNSSQATSPYIFSGISIDGGLVNVGTSASNIIGSASSPGNIAVTVATNAGGYVVGIASSGISSTTPVISNNVISGITVANPSPGNVYVHLRGIYIVSQPATISGNIVGSTGVVNSLLNTSGNTSVTNCLVTGITSTSSSAVSISGNQISNLAYNAGGALFQVVGIYTTNGTNNISSNTISVLSASNQNTQTGNGASVIGILDNNNTSTGETLSQNVIYTLSNAYSTSAAVNVYGIAFSCAGSSHTISRNIIYDLRYSLSNTNVNGELNGIRLSVGNPTISNNMIALGNGVTNNPFINAINLQGGTPKVYYNSVALAGIASGTGFSNSIRFQSVSSGTECINNVFYNNRTSTSPANNQAMYFMNTSQRDNVTTCNYNDLYINASNTILTTVTGGVGSPYGSLSLWQANSGGKDANSISQSVSFESISSDLHLTDCVLAGKGTSLSTIVDYDGSTRNTIPWIGADEPFITWNGGTGNWNAGSNWTPTGPPSGYHDVIISSGSVSLDADGLAHSLTIGTGANLSANAYKITLGATACINSFFANNGTFNANTGTVQFDGAIGGLSGSISGTTATAFNNIILKTGVTFPAPSLQATVNSYLQLDSGSYVGTNSPIYGSSSTLIYNTNTAYSISNEWTSHCRWRSRKWPP